MFKDKYQTFLLLSGVSGWVIALILVFFSYGRMDVDTLIKTKISENAFNIVSQSLQGKDSDKEIVSQMKEWFDKGWTAQTGSVQTICDNDRNLFKKIMTEETISTICRLHI